VIALWTGTAKPADVRLGFDAVFVPLRCRGHAGAMGLVAWTELGAACRYYARGADKGNTRKKRS
jgi:hypothetical protein